MYKSILFPVDVHDEISLNAAVPVVKGMKKSFKSKLTVVTVLPDFGAGIVSQYFTKAAEQKIFKETEAKLNAFVKNHLDGEKDIKCLVAQGGIYERIIETAKKTKADLIVMTAHRPELKDYLLGPNAAKVVRHSNISVLVVREKY